MALLELLSDIFGGVAREQPLSGARRLAGLHGPVEIFFTDGGIPHVYARDEEDLFFAQGYLTACERLFQMDFVRRAAAGRLAEVVGNRPLAWRELTVYLKGRTTVDVDHLTRLLGLGRSARASALASTGRARRALQRYAQGVNARISEGALPVEFRLLRYAPEPWAPEDSYLVMKAMALELNVSWRAILTYGALHGVVQDEAQAAALFPAYPVDAEPIVPGSAELAAMAAAVSDTMKVGGPHAGSNNWVLSGERTASGAPYLCNDPHLQLTSPAAFYVAHLAGGDFDVAGASIPGVPGIILGHNEEVAWGATIAMAHDTDLFVEELDGERYRNGEETEPLKVRTEEIRVRGAPPVVRRVRETRRGPLLTDLLPAGEKALSFCWTAQGTTREIDAILGMNAARTAGELKEALGGLCAPALNVVYADRGGTIGYLTTGQYPLRAAPARYLPVDGACGRNDWKGRVPFEELPRIENPPGGLLVTANNRIAAKDFPHYLAELYEPPYRAARIRQLLQEQERHSIDDMVRIQMDVHSLWARRLVEGLLRPLAKTALPVSQPARDALALLLEWDCDATPDSPAAAVFYAFYLRLVSRQLKTLLGEDLFHGYFELLNASVVPVENLLLSATSPFHDARERDELAVRALEDAVHELRRRRGDDPRGWRWGGEHTLHLRHRMHELKPLRFLLSPGPFETGGDGMTVNNGQFFFSNPSAHVLGAAYRQIFDLANWDTGRVVLAGGQSGNPLSPRYRDHVERWLNGAYFPLPFSRTAVERAAIGGAASLVPEQTAA